MRLAVTEKKFFGGRAVGTTTPTCGGKWSFCKIALAVLDKNSASVSQDTGWEPPQVQQVAHSRGVKIEAEFQLKQEANWAGNFFRGLFLSGTRGIRGPRTNTQYTEIMRSE